MKLLQKQLEIEDLSNVAKLEKSQGKKIVLCLGVFDLLHPGHIRHFEAAKQHGDILIVAVTADPFVNKGPDRPVFSQQLRMEAIAAIESVDFVCVNNHLGGLEVIRALKPDYYAKGVEYKEHEEDITGKIKLEEAEVTKNGGKLVYTDDIVFSSSKLLNNHFSETSLEVKKYIKTLKHNYSTDQVLQSIDDLSTLKVLVIGDAIIDEYKYVKPLGVSGKGTHLVARCCDSDIFLGGAFAVANHVAAFTSNVTLLTAVGADDTSFDYLGLSEAVKREFLYHNESKTLIKCRYVQKDGTHLTKLFETYSSNDNLLNEYQENQFVNYLEKNAKDFDLVLVCDFGNGFLCPRLNAEISKIPNFLAVNTQINSGNRGYHVVTKYERADYISLNEPEIRLTAHDLYSDLSTLIVNLSESLKSQYIGVTQGVQGLVIYDQAEGFSKIPALTQKVIDRVGAGDSYFALSALALAKKYDAKLAAFLGSVAAALDVQIIGNKKCIEKIPLKKYITSLLK
ncbi:MAG: Bifunctional protein HldE [Chlamydiae bacterium]|nr:Bifunctional protein HldE [Chlamydiota bacterium]